MLYIFYGADDFSVNERVEALKASLGDRDMLSASTSLFEGRQYTLKELAAVCDTTPFLTPKRLVVVRGLLERFEVRPGEPGDGRGRGSEGGKLGEWSGLADYVRRMPDWTVLALIDGGLKRSNPLLKALSSLATVTECPLLRGEDLHRWIVARVAANKGTISPEAARSLIEHVGPNLWVLTSEIDKLLLYARGRTIESKDVVDLVSYVRESSVFNMLDAIIEQRTSQALKVFHELLRDGAATSYIVTMIAWQLRLLVSCKPLVEANASPPEILKALKLGPNYPITKLIRNCRNVPSRNLEAAYYKLLEADIQVKTGKYPDELALELLIAELSRSGLGR